MTRFRRIAVLDDELHARLVDAEADRRRRMGRGWMLAPRLPVYRRLSGENALPSPLGGEGQGEGEVL